MRWLARLIQRVAVFGLGVFAVWLIVFVVFRVADNRLPWTIAVGVTYGIAAYVILPRIVRLGHVSARADVARSSAGAARAAVSLSALRRVKEGMLAVSR